ncbi:MAG: ABC transporter permease [Brevibacterium yomogidense]|uniref:ABC transporter permease n=1 Tax=Brevibacterium sp. Mu109 TaxID=1255669 RepID=UPI000C5B2028|nr:ABC transporter permease [Brevibacterium sp. Mu109]SMX79895.1 molybdate transport system permease protein [Brevibacterium sp. Mu109]
MRSSPPSAGGTDTHAAARGGTRRRPLSRERSPGIPWGLAPFALLGALVVILPVVGLTLRVPWSEFGGLVTSPDSLTALRLSLATACVSAGVCVVLGVPLGMMLARSEAVLLRAVRAFVLLPVVLPPVVGGLALLATFGRQGLLAAPMEATGIDIAFTTAAVICAQVFVSLPFVVMGVESAMRTHGTDFETAAAVLGAGPGRTFATVTLPLLVPAIASSAVLSFARSLGEFGATLTFAGSLAGTTRTLPLEIYLRRETDPDAAVAVSMLLVAIALLVVIAVYSLPQSWRRGSPARVRTRAAASMPPAHEGRMAGTQETTAAEVPVARRARPPRLVVEFDAPDRRIAQSFTVEPGETLALTGPNGVGKSTILAVVAGLLIPPRARVEVDDRVLTHIAGGRSGADVPPHRRSVTLLLQDPRLFPHMTAGGNIAFGLRAAGVTGAHAKAQSQRMLDDLGIGHLGRVKPRGLSGGQRARVALARALATDPQIVLLDEPSAALDADSAPQIRALLRELLADRTCVLVSHDPAEVQALADREIRLAHD